jgi:Ser/Thr protein kinase RdoA (MazF antagonist)
MLLKDLRSAATVATRLAISLSISTNGPEQRERRERFRAAVDALGEPVRNDLAPENAEQILAGARWRAVDASERSRRAGFVVAAPVWEPAAAGAPATASRIGRFMERMYHRRGIDGLGDHLAAAYDIAVTGTGQLDVGVFRVQRGDGPAWIARLFAAARPVEAARGDAEILRFLARAGFPAERCARQEPVTVYQEQAVLVTEYVSGRTAAGSDRTFRALGDLLGRLHAIPPASGAMTRPGGAWHHLVVQGGPHDEIVAAGSLLEDAVGRVPPSQRKLHALLRSELERVDIWEGLPQSLIHPDFVPANVVTARTGDATVVDWTGAGRGPRLWPLAYLLWAAGARSLRCVEVALSGYRRHVALEPDELERLAAAIVARPLVLACWAFCTGRDQLADVAARLGDIQARAETIARRASASPVGRS